MAVEFRPLHADELRTFAYNSRLGFGDPLTQSAIDYDLAVEFLKPAETLGAFDDGVLASQMGTIPFTMRWNGRDIGCGGVTAVSTLPTHRRRGYLRELMTRAFATMRGSNQPVAMLWASMAAIYQRFGYGVGYTQLQYRGFDPRTLRFVDEIPVTGRTRLIRADEAAPVLSSVYDRFASTRTLMLRRDQQRWNSFVLRPWPADTPPYRVVVYDEDGEDLGFGIYRIEQMQTQNPGPSLRLNVFDLAWLTPAAHRGLIMYFAGYDLAGQIAVSQLPIDDPLFYQAQEPRLLNGAVRDGTLVRIVDVVAALEGRGYDGDGSLRFSIADDLCPWNTGTWDLTVESGSAHVKATTGEPDLLLTPRLLAILASGHQSATTLAHIGSLPACDPAARRTADALLRTEHAPLCTDGF
jgi:predicted acetyltransferase